MSSPSRDSARGGFQEPRHDTHERRLPGAVGADEAEHALGDLQIHSLESGYLARIDFCAESGSRAWICLAVGERRLPGPAQSATTEQNDERMSQPARTANRI